MKHFISTAIKKIAMGLLLAGLLLLATILFAKYSPDLSTNEILIQSSESRTLQNQPVYNKIKFIRSNGKDIWMMSQSHSGSDLSKEKWDRLAIVIEGTKAKFYQLKSGELNWNEQLPFEQTEFRATCMMCHNNGPRYIRPDEKSWPLFWNDKIRVAALNLKIKMYPRLKMFADEKVFQRNAKGILEQLERVTPFELKESIEQQTLSVKTCNFCHKEEGFFARGKLKRQQAGTIEYMFKSGHMPPLGMSLTPSETRQLQDFVAGF